MSRDERSGERGYMREELGEDKRIEEKGIICEIKMRGEDTDTGRYQEEQGATNYEKAKYK